MNDVPINLTTVAALAANKNLTSLSIDKAKIGDAGLDINFNPIGDAGVIALENHPNLIELNAQGVQMTEKGAISLAKKSNLSKLKIGFNKIGDTGLAAFGNNTSIISLMILEQWHLLKIQRLKPCMLGVIKLDRKESKL